jgi:two-component system, LytTR family, response regulator
MSFTTIIIDDEAPARIRLRRLLASHKDTIHIIDEACDGIEALDKIDALKPDVIFLDIQMPGLRGFELLEKLTHIPLIIFTTAFDEYALKAFEANSIDYLLKPIDTSRLDGCIKKLTRITNPSDKGQMQNFMQMVNQLKPQKEMTSFPVKIGDKIILVRLSEVAYLEAKDKYVSIHTLAGKEYIISQSLKMLEGKLPDYFLRIHRAFTVNKNHVSELHKYFQGRYIIRLNDKDFTKITCGSSYIDDIRRNFEL